MPLPLTTLSGEVVDPAQAALSLDDALKIGRATPPDIIGTNPVARLMVISNSNSGSGYKPTLAWVIVTDDAPPFRGTGLPTTSSPPPYNGCLSWTIIAMDGRVLDHLQNRYFAPNRVPELPRQGGARWRSGRRQMGAARTGQGRRDAAREHHAAGPRRRGRYHGGITSALPGPANLSLGEIPMAVGSSNSFDLVVLGAGTGGYAAAFRGAQLGLRVALVDEDKIGGTCLHRGCIPTKALLESADFYHRVTAKSRELGVLVAGDVALDYAAVAARRDQVVRRMWTGLKGLIGKNKVEWVAGRGRLDGAGKVRVALHGEDGTPGTGGERVLEATDVILATGSRVKSLPGITPDGVRILTSDDVLKMSDLPASIVIVGAGAVGSEFASMFHDYGVKVTLLEYLPAIVPLEDRDVSKELERSFRRRGIEVMTNARFDAASLKVGEDGIRLTVGPDGGEAKEVAADCILVATGRAANVEGIGLETTRITVERGIIPVDGHMRTAEPHVWAIGDIVGGLWLAHTAAHEGLTAVHTIVGDADVHAMDYDAQPRATYCRPEIASVGITEQECEKRNLPVKVGKVPFQAIAKALIGGEYEGFAKVIAHAETGETLGVHIVGPHATDLIAEASLGFTLEAAAWEIAAATHPHPTLSEVLGEAAMAVDGRSLNF